MDFMRNFIKKKWINVSYILIILLCILFLCVDINFFYIKHNNLGPSLPVITYVYYPNWTVINFYLIISLCSIDILSLSFLKERFQKVILALTPIIGFFSVILIITNPEYLILFPEGRPPTRLETLQLGGLLYIFATVALIIMSLYTIYKEKFIKRYLQYVGLFFAVWLVSTFIHENGHAFFVILSGGEITKYAPLPFLDFDNLAGYVAWRYVPSELIPLVVMGGEIFQWISIPIMLAIIKFKKWNNWITLFLVLKVIVAWLDFPLYSINNTFGIPHWFLIGGSSGDIIKFTNMTGFPLLLMNLFALLQLLIGVFIIYFKLFRNREKILQIFKEGTINEEIVKV